jgi:hypothetical protein
VSVQQIILYATEDVDIALAAAATDGKEVVTTYADALFAGHSLRDDLLDTMTKSFVRKLELEALKDLPPIERLAANLQFYIDDPVEFATFEEATAAAQEAFNG